jgi:RNA polymerase II subunit A small phosphatase-like protein
MVLLRRGGVRDLRAGAQAADAPDVAARALNRDKAVMETGRLLLILDLDETLIHASETELHRPPDFALFGYHVYKRPHLAEFLEASAQWFELAVWSSGTDDYVEKVVETIFPDPGRLQFIWGRSRTTLSRAMTADGATFHSPLEDRHYLKPLAKISRRGRWRLEQMLIVDDTPEKCARNYGNAIYIRPFEGDERDDELKRLIAYLPSLKDCPNVRKVEKRPWRFEAAATLPREP